MLRGNQYQGQPTCAGGGLTVAGAANLGAPRASVAHAEAVVGAGGLSPLRFYGVDARHTRPLTQIVQELLDVRT